MGVWYIKAKITKKAVEDFKNSVKIGDRYMYQLPEKEVIKERTAVTRSVEVCVTKKYSFIVTVKELHSKNSAIKTMTYTELFAQKKNIRL